MTSTADHALKERTPHGRGEGNRALLVAALVGAVGLLVQTVGYSVGWSSSAELSTPALLLWLAGLVLLVAPFSRLLLLAGLTDRQRLAGSLILAHLMLLSWWLYNPVLSLRYDETLHVTTLVNMIQRGGFFVPNPMLPVSPYFPGLQLATVGVHWLTGLPLIVCQLVVVALARTVFVVALFVFVHRITRSGAAAATGVIVYAASPQFYFFNAQFAYQTVAIALLMLLLWLLSRAFDRAELHPGKVPWRQLVQLYLIVAALAITHHLTSWVMLAALGALAVLLALGREWQRLRLTLLVLAGALVINAAWQALVAPEVLGYIREVFSFGVTEVREVLTGNAAPRDVGGVSGESDVTPRWQFALMFCSILGWCLLLVPSCWATWRRGLVGRSPTRYLLLVVAAAYPFLQLGRIASRLAEIGDRTTTFVFMAMAVVVGAWLGPLLAGPAVTTAHRVLRASWTPVATVLLVGGLMLGSGPSVAWIPGPYIPGGAQRGIDARTVAVAEWASRYLPAGATFGASRDMNRFLPNVADVEPITFSGERVNVTPIFLATHIDATVLRLITDNKIDFLIVDRRFIGHTRPTWVSGLFEGQGNPDLDVTVTAAMLDKFNHYPGIHKILDGPVAVYDLRPLRGAPVVFADRPPEGLPGSSSPVAMTITLVVGLALVILRRRLLDPRRADRRHLPILWMTLPALMLLGAVGVLTGVPVWAGSAILVVGAGVLVARVPQPTTAMPVHRAHALVAGLTCALVLAAGAISTISAWQAMFHGPELPPPWSQPR